MVDIEGEKVPLRVNWHNQARRFILRLDAQSGGARLTLPPHANLNDAIGFLKRNERWLLKERRRLEPIGEDEANGAIPFRGELHDVITIDGGRRGITQKTAGLDERRARLVIAGPEETSTSRLVRWLKSEARADLEVAVAHHAATLSVKPQRIAIRDQRSRWGSCSTSGTLSFSWRLVLAPPEVLDYVAAHEVAHLREMNHAPAFWNLVAQTYGNTREPRAWLRKNGPGLHRIGQSAES